MHNRGLDRRHVHSGSEYRRRGGARGGLRPSGEAAGAPGRRRRVARRARDGIHGGRAIVGPRDRAGPGSRGFRLPASPATSSRSSRIARSCSGSTRVTPGISLHIPWDKTENPGELRAFAARARAVLRLDELEHVSGSAGTAVVVQVRQPQPHGCGGAAAGHRAQSRMSRDSARRWARARTRCGLATAATFPGQLHFRRALDRYLESMTAIYRALPDDWRLFIEHKFYEPAFYSTVLNDWGTSYYCARELGDRALLARRSRPPCAERQRRDDRREADSVRQARRLSLQRQPLRRRRPRCGVGEAVSAVPDFQRARRCRAIACAGIFARLHARPVAQRHRPDRIARRQQRRDRRAPTCRRTSSIARRSRRTRSRTIR